MPLIRYGSSSSSGGGGAWTPASEGSNSLWLDATQNVTHSTNAVTQWVDAGDSNRWADRTGAGAEPTRLPAERNGLDAIRFTNKGMYLNGAVGCSVTGSIIYACNAKVGGGSAGSSVVLGFYRTSGFVQNHCSVGYGAQSAILYRQGSPAVFYQSNAMTSGELYAWRVWEFHWNYNTMECFRDGVSVGTGSISALFHFDAIGWYGNAGLCDVDIGEIAVFSKQLTGASLTNARTYFARWR